MGLRHLSSLTLGIFVFDLNNKSPQCELSVWSHFSRPSVVDDVRTAGAQYWSLAYQSQRGFIAGGPGMSHGEPAGAVNSLTVTNFYGYRSARLSCRGPRCAEVSVLHQ